MKEKQTKVFRIMMDRHESYTSISEKLRQEGYIFNARTVYRYITGKEVPSKPVKKAIAEVLGCLVSDIF